MLDRFQFTYTGYLLSSYVALALKNLNFLTLAGGGRSLIRRYGAFRHYTPAPTFCGLHLRLAPLVVIMSLKNNPG